MRSFQPWTDPAGDGFQACTAVIPTDGGNKRAAGGSSIRRSGFFQSASAGRWAETSIQPSVFGDGAGDGAEGGEELHDGFGAEPALLPSRSLAERGGEAEWNKRDRVMGTCSLMELVTPQGHGMKEVNLRTEKAKSLWASAAGFSRVFPRKVN